VIINDSGLLFGPPCMSRACNLPYTDNQNIFATKGLT